ncbi:MAG: trigger factor [Candidatus Peribacteraceae bacterium]|nr:trigger factor [Candidatus Peribacteraceae bacterium]
MTDDTTTIPVKKEKNGVVTCTVSFEEDKVKKSEEAALIKLGKDVKLDGFRPGNAPAEAVKEKVNPDKLIDETIRGLLPEVLEKIVMGNGLHPIIPPKVDIKNMKPMTLEITFFEKPEVKVKGGSKISVKAKEETVDEKEVDRLIKYILQQHQKSADKTEPAEEGDRITMDFTGETLDGKEVPELKTEGHQAVIGSKTLLPGFEDELKGLKTGDKKDFTLTFPEKHQKEELRGKPVGFHVNIIKVENLEVPELTDDFVKANMQAESVEKFKDDVKKSMLLQQKDTGKKQEEEKALDEIRKATVVDLAPELIDDELKALMDDLQKQLQKENMSFEDWMKRVGKTQEEALKDLQEQAKNRLTMRLGLAQLVEDRKIEVSDEEMKNHIDLMMNHIPEEQKKDAAKMYGKGQQGYEQFKWQKKVEKLLSEIIQN